MLVSASLARVTAWSFSALTLVFAAILALPTLLKRPLSKMAHLAVLLVFLVVYTGCLLLLVNTAHEGGRLVHEFGVQALIPPE